MTKSICTFSIDPLICVQFKKMYPRKASAVIEEYMRSCIEDSTLGENKEEEILKQLEEEKVSLQTAKEKINLLNGKLQNLEIQKNKEQQEINLFVDKKTEHLRGALSRLDEEDVESGV